MNELVVVNGIVQGRSQYMVSGDNIVFHTAPPWNSEINIIMDETTHSYHGDGSTFVFQRTLSEKIKFKRFMEEVYDRRYNPSVKDALEKLKIVMELVR